MEILEDFPSVKLFKIAHFSYDYVADENGLPIDPEHPFNRGKGG